MCLLAQINPLKSAHPHPHHHENDLDEIRTVQLHHAHQVCGIVAHTKDHGVASVAIRSLAIAGSVLHEPREQHEVLDILTRIYHHTGWNLKRVHSELKRAWGWEPPEPPLSGVPSSGPGSSAAGLPHPAPQQQPLLAPAAQGGTLGAAAVISQLFGPRDPNNAVSQQQQQQDHYNGNNTGANGRRSTQATTPGPGPPPAPIQPSTSTTSMTETLRANLTTGPRPPTLHQHQHQHQNQHPHQQSFHRARHNSVISTTANGSSNHTSPAATTHTPASVSSTTNNAPTPPSAVGRPTVNPLLAQADFNQPNHPYREWYKPPERPAAERERTGGGGFGSGGLWPY